MMIGVGKRGVVTDSDEAYWEWAERRQLVVTVLMMVICIGLMTRTRLCGTANRRHEGDDRRSARIVREKELKQPAKAEERRQLLEKVVGGSI